MIPEQHLPGSHALFMYVKL